MRASLPTLLLALALASHAATEPPVLLLDGDRPRLLAASGDDVPPPPAGLAVEGVHALQDGYLLTGLRRQGNGERPSLLLRTAAGETELSVPATARRAAAPAPLLAAGRLLGAAWLEGAGPRSMAVKAAHWSGNGWSAPTTVSPPGPGSQLALSAAVLADGRWLLVWSAFDGHDDEILWATGTPAGRFGPAQRLTDNEVPDITPAVLALESHALVAWSQYDGNDYRLHIARLDRSSWLAERVAGGRGSFAPTWHPGTDGRALLVARDSEAAGWRLLDVDEGGRTSRQAVVVAPPDQRPAPELSADGSLRLLWADGRRDAAAWSDDAR